MGLDMYLEKEVYIGANYDHRKIGGKLELTKNGVPIPVRLKKVSSINEQVGYWRKANQIHNWFVENVQDGRDECQRAYVPFEKLKELLTIVDTVLQKSKLVDGVVVNGYSSKAGEPWKPNYEKGKMIEDTSLAEKLLPSNTNGCFFGSADYDQWYHADLKETKRILDEIMKDDPKGENSYYYQSSW